MKTLIAAIAVSLTALAFAATAGAPCCQECGCNSCVRKICRRVCEMKEVKSYEYSCKCEDFCVPGPSQNCHMHCKPDCKEPHGVKYEQHCDPPCWAEVHTKNKLYKHEVVKKVPHYKWVVEHVCDACAARHAPCDQGHDPAEPHEAHDPSSAPLPTPPSPAPPMTSASKGKDDRRPQPNPARALLSLFQRSGQ